MHAAMKIYLFVFLFTFASISYLSGQIPESEREITASSTLPPSTTSTFTPDHLMDGTAASWSEGAEGSGVGESIQFFMRYPDYLDYVMIKNGFGNEKYWSANNRVRELRIISESGDSRLITLEDTSALRVYGTIGLNEDEYGDLQKGEPLYGRQFIFRIESVYKGNRWDDACISEIAFNQWRVGTFNMDEDYVNKNLFRIFLDGVFGPEGELYYLSDYSGMVPARIQDGYFYREVTSGDGTGGHLEYQVFSQRDGGQPVMFTSKYLTYMAEVAPSKRKGKEKSRYADDAEWEEQEEFSEAFYRFDPDTDQFHALTMAEIASLFETHPCKALSGLSGLPVEQCTAWLVCGSSPHSIKAVYPPSISDPEYEMEYIWNGRQFVLVE